jgi:glycine betaine/proline transport system substrate-binding protein
MSRFPAVFFLAALAATLLISCAPESDPGKKESALPGEGITVQPGRATWTTGFFSEAIYSQGLKELGYDVKAPKDLSNPIFYQAVCQGDVDFWANGWYPLHKAQFPKDFDEKAKVAGHVVKSGALQGYLVSKAHAEKYAITSLDDFKRKDVKKAFDSDGDGKADLVACPPGWGCEKAIAFHLEQYGLNEHIHPIKAGYSASMASALAAYKAGKPVFFYTWTPNWTLFKLKPGQDVVWINVPKNIPRESEKEWADYMTQTGITGAVTDPLKMGFPANDLVVIANKKFLEKNPAAAKLFEIMSLSLADIALQNNLMFGGEKGPKDIQRHVAEWKALNMDKWNAWLDEAKKAAM